MANRRLYLEHRPTGKQICLGKRFGEGWHVPPSYKTRDDVKDLYDSLNEFFEDVEDYTDDFILVLDV